MEALKKGFLVLIVGIVIFLLGFLVPWDMFLPPWNLVQGRNWIINSGAEDFLQVDFLWGATIRGQIWCYGGNYDIDFLIRDSSGYVCLDPGRVYNEHRFKWHVPYNDIYSFKFSNTFSGSSKDVGYLIFSYYYMHIFLIIGAIVVAMGLFLILKEVIKTAVVSSERISEQPSPLLVEEESKELIEGLRKETEDLKGAVKNLQVTIAELLERTREPKTD